MTSTKILRQTGGSGLFAHVVIDSTASASGSNVVVLGPKATQSGNYSSIVQTTRRGIMLALDDLEVRTARIEIVQIRVSLVDATEAGFAMAGYQATFEELTGSPSYLHLSDEDLEEIAVRTNSKLNGI